MKVGRLLNMLVVAGAGAFLVYAAVMEFGLREEGAERTTITMLSSGSRQQKSAYEEAIAAFEREHPDIHVDMEWGTSGDFFGVLLTRMAGGVPPDVMFMYEFKMPYFARKGTLLDLTPFLGGDIDGSLSDFHPKAREVFTYQDKLYAVPVTMAPIVLFYNRDVFDQAGVPYPNASWTWQTLRETARRLTRRDEKDRIVQYGLARTLHYQMIDIITGRRRLGNGTLRPNFLDSEILAALRFNADLTLTDRSAPDLAAAQEQSTSNLFGSGKAAMDLTGRWMVPVYNDIEGLDYDVAPIPKWRNGFRATYTHAVGYSVSAETEHPKESWEFAKYLGSRPALQLLTDLGDTVPARLSVLHSKAFMTPGERPAHDEVFAEALDYSLWIQVVDPSPPEYFKEAVEAVMIGQTDPETAMTEVERKMERFVQQKDAALLH